LYLLKALSNNDFRHFLFFVHFLLLPFQAGGKTEKKSPACGGKPGICKQRHVSSNYSSVSE